MRYLEPLVLNMIGAMIAILILFLILVPLIWILQQKGILQLYTKKPTIPKSDGILTANEVRKIDRKGFKNEDDDDCSSAAFLQ